MIALVLALQMASGGVRVPVVYDQVPPEVVRVEVYAWNGDRPGRKEEARYGSRRFVVTGTAHALYVVALFRSDGRYLVDGPFAWPDREATRAAVERWRRTLGGALSEAVDANARVELIQPGPQHSAWPVCFAGGSRRWSCWGVGADDRGIVVAYSGGSIWWTTTAVSGLQAWQSARWGRMVVIGGAVSEVAPPRVSIQYPVAPPAARIRAIRLDTAAVPDARAVALSASAVWVAGDGIPPKAWLEVVSDLAAPAYVPLADVAAAPPSLPLHVTLRERRVIDGRVSAAGGEPAGAALISVFRLIDPPAQRDGRAVPRRVAAMESVADEAGKFALAGLGDADYELLAWHGQLGQASVAISAAVTQLDIRLQSSGIARGRVFAGGRVVEGVDVISVPDPAAFSAVEDVTQVKGGDARTASDGRFSVTIAPSGGGELRIGGGAYPVKRIPLPRAPVPLFDAGDIDLGRRIPISVVVSPDVGCGLRAAGPVGRSGLQILTGVRTPGGAFELAIPEPGFWEFTMMCAQEARPLSPSVIQIGLSDAGREVRMTVR